MPTPPPGTLPTPTVPAAETLTLLDPPHPSADDVVAVVARWHDDTHPGPWAFCDEQPCHAVRRANQGPYGREDKPLAVAPAGVLRKCRR